MSLHHHWARGDRGQTTLALAGVVAGALLLAVGVGAVGQAAVHRARARGAADAVALAGARSAADAAALSDWYASAHNITIEPLADGGVRATSGPSQAAAWARLEASTVRVAPVLVAVLARAEQLTGATFVDISWHTDAVELTSADAAILATVAADLGLCHQMVDAEVGAPTRFAMC